MYLCANVLVLKTEEADNSRVSHWNSTHSLMENRMLLYLGNHIRIQDISNNRWSPPSSFLILGGLIVINCQILIDGLQQCSCLQTNCSLTYLDRQTYVGTALWYSTYRWRWYAWRTRTVIIFSFIPQSFNRWCVTMWIQLIDPFRRNYPFKTFFTSLYKSLTLTVLHLWDVSRCCLFKSI